MVARATAPAAGRERGHSGPPSAHPRLNETADKNVRAKPEKLEPHLASATFYAMN
jgi:hypothetical protein